MAIYRTVHLSFWTDNKVADDFTPEDKYFYLYLITNPHTNLCGCYEYSLKQMSDETGYNKDTIIRLLERMQNIHSVIKYSPVTKEILLLNWGKYNWTKSEKLSKPIISQIESIKNTDFKPILKDIYKKIDTVSIPYLYSMDTTDTVTDTETVNVTDNNKSGKPDHTQTINDVITYLNQKTNSHYKSGSSKTKTCIIARLNDGYSIDDFKTVIDKKVKEWTGTEFEKFLRPETLFGSKFDGYINQKDCKQAKKNSFNDFSQKQDYDFASIEEKLLGRK